MTKKYVLYDCGNGKDVDDTIYTEEEARAEIARHTEEERAEMRELDIFFVNIADEGDAIEF